MRTRQQATGRHGAHVPAAQRETDGAELTPAAAGKAAPAGMAQRVPEPGAHRARYLFPKTPWHSPLPDRLAAREAAMPPSFVPLASDDEIERRIVLHHRKRRSWGKTLARVFLYGVSIVLVLAAGLITTVWVEDNGGLEATVAMLVSKSVAPSGRTADNPHARPSRDELPYDGQAPDDARHLAARTAVPIDPAAPASAGGQVPDKETGTNGKNGKNARGETPSSSGAASDAGDSQAAAGNPALKNKADAPDAADAPAKTASKPQASPQKLARGKEISRIQRQAAEELKKKTRQRRNTALAARKKRGARNPATQRISYAKSLARCERAGNFFRREHCRFKVCNGNWGKGGCPSYVAVSFTAD